MLFLAWEDYRNFYLAVWAVYFYKIKGMETLSGSHNLNVVDDNVGLTELLQIN
jgi:hypothetical protein